MTGYVRGQRDRFDHALFRGEKYCRGYAWDWLVAHAAWKDHQVYVKGKVVTIRRGQLCHSVRHIAGAWNWSKSAVERFLTRLETETMIGTDAETGQLIITICNYDKYQAGDDESGTRHGPTDGTAAGQRRDNIEEGKKEKTEDSVSLARDTAAAPLDEIAEAVTAYNVAAGRMGWPMVQKLTKPRRQHLSARLRDAGGISGWRLAIERAEASRFIRGPNNWFCFDWLCKDTNFTKLMEGNYDDRPGSQRGSPGADAGADQIANAVAIRQAQRRDRGLG